jgi:hypothetical protein
VDVPAFAMPRVLWSLGVPSGWRVVSGPSGFALVGERSIHVLDPATGRERWRARASGPCAVAGDMLLAGPPGRETARALVDGRVLSRSSARATAEHSRAWAEGFLVRFHRRNHLEAFGASRAGGPVTRRLWRYPAEGSLERTLAGGTDLTITGRAVVLWGDAAFCVLDRVTGAERFRGVGSPVFADDAGILAACDGGALTLHRSDGRVVWTVPGERGQNVLAFGPEVVAVRRRGAIALLARRTGKPLGALPAAASVSALVRGAVLHVPDAYERREREAATVAASSPRGRELWRVTAPGFRTVEAVAPLARGLILLLGGRASPPGPSPGAALLVALGHSAGARARGRARALVLSGEPTLGVVAPEPRRGARPRGETTYFFADDEWDRLEPRLRAAGIPFRESSHERMRGGREHTVAIVACHDDRVREVVRTVATVVAEARRARRPTNPVFVVWFDVRVARETHSDGWCMVGAATRSKARGLALEHLGARIVRLTGEPGARVVATRTQPLEEYEREMEDVLDRREYPCAGEVRLAELGS